MLAERKLTPYQGLLHAIWTDERLSAVCTTMRNTDHIRENTDAARRFEPLKEAEIHQLRDATLAHGSMLCADCDGRCSIAAGTQAELGNLTRFLTYFPIGNAARLTSAVGRHILFTFPIGNGDRYAAETRNRHHDDHYRQESSNHWPIRSGASASEQADAAGTGTTGGGGNASHFRIGAREANPAHGCGE